MSCDIASAAAVFWFAAMSPQEPGLAPRPVAVAAAPAGPSALSREPLYAEIVGRAKSLRQIVEDYRKAPAADPLPRFDDFRAQVDALAALDLKGHLDLAQRGTDGDLKCILRGISMDLPKRLQDLAAAPGPAARQDALRDMGFLLRDNVEVITAPPAPAV